MEATGEQAVVQCRAKLAEEMVSWEKYAPYCGLSPAEEQLAVDVYGVQKRQMLQRWKARSGEDVTYRNLAGIFESVEDQTLADFVRKLAQNKEPNSRSIGRTL